MKAQDVVIQLATKLPAQTGVFSNNIAISSIVPSGTTATVTTATPHGATTSDYVTIVNATAPVAITTLTRAATVVSVETSADHDLTLSSLDTGKTVTISGANEAEFNGTFTLLSVPNRRNFTFQTADSGATTGTGTMLLENGSAYGYNGLFQITVTSTTTYTYTLPKALTVAAGGSPEHRGAMRISAGVTLDRCADSYTKQNINNLWAFVVLGDVTASKDRHIQNDATAAVGGLGTAFRQKLIQPFSVYVFVPTKAQIAARDARDLMEDIAVNMIASLAGHKFGSGFYAGAQREVIFESHGFQGYDTSTYIHEFNFSTLTDIYYEDTVGGPFNVAFRDIALSITPDVENGTLIESLTANIDLDDEPL